MYENKYKVLVLKNNNRKTKDRESKFEKIVLCNNRTIDPQSKNANKNMQYGMISLDDGKYNSIKYDNKSILLYNDVPAAIQKRLIDNCINV